MTSKNIMPMITTPAPMLRAITAIELLPLLGVPDFEAEAEA